MPKRTITEREGGFEEATADVIVIYDGIEDLVWENQNFNNDGDTIEFTLKPGVKEAFNFEHAKRVFGDWELPKAKRSQEKVWADMIKDRCDRSPSLDGRLVMVKIYDEEDNLLWDATKEYAHWMERHGAKMLPRPDKKSGITVEMPKILAEADGDALKKLWLHSTGCKLPAGMKFALARDLLLPRLDESQIADVLSAEFEKEPDMSKYDKT